MIAGKEYFPLEKDDSKKLKKNNVAIAIVLYVKKYISCLCFKKQNSNHEKQVILLMISNGQK